MGLVICDYFWRQMKIIWKLYEIYSEYKKIIYFFRETQINRR